MKVTIKRLVNPFKIYYSTQVTNWTFEKRNIRGTQTKCAAKSTIENRECTTYKISLYKQRKVFPTLTDLKSHFQISKTMTSKLTAFSFFEYITNSTIFKKKNSNLTN